MNKLHSLGKQLLADIQRFWLAVVLALLYLMVSNYFFRTPCPIAILFHFPCPGCGMTRACTALFNCQFSQAIHYHAMIFLWLPLIIYFVIFRYVFQKEPPLFLPICIGIGLTSLLYYACRLLSGSAFLLVA